MPVGTRPSSAGFDPLVTTVLISIGGTIVARCCCRSSAWRPPAAWPWCAASVLIHLVYFAALIESYRAGDMGQVYPIARGSAPLMTALATTASHRRTARTARLVRHRPAGRGIVSAVAARRPRACAARPQSRRFRAVHRGHDLRLHRGRWHRRASRRRRQRLFGRAVPVHRSDDVALRARASRARRLCRRWRAIGGSVLGGGIMQVGSYGIAIWAMTVAPIAIVGALRETSVLFGTAIAVVFLKEPVRASRIVAASMIVAALALDPIGLRCRDERSVPAPRVHAISPQVMQARADASAPRPRGDPRPIR